MKKFLYLLLAAVTATSLLSGCGSKDKKKDVTEIKVHATKSELDDGCIYVRHKDGTFDQVYAGNNEKAKKTNVFWFRDDFKKVPHLVLGKGDTLVYYSTKDASGQFDFKRYYDLGYTIGLCALTPDKNTGRYSISTDKDDENTYPKSKADELLNTQNDNKTAVIDSIGGYPIRRKTNTDENSSDDTDDTDDTDSTDDTESTDNTDETADSDTDSTDMASGIGKDKVSSELVSRYGTIKNLRRNNLYTVQTYNGSIRKSLTLKADVKAMGFAGEYKSSSYVYGEGKDTNLITIKIPSWFNTGYYTIQTDKTDVAMFAFINGDSYDENTDFNKPNIVPEDKADATENTESGNDAESFDNYMNIKFKQSGYADITFTIDHLTDEDANEMSGFSAGFFAGDEVINFAAESPGVYVARVNVAEGQTYKIGYSGLSDSLANRAVVNYEFE